MMKTISFTFVVKRHWVLVTMETSLSQEDLQYTRKSKSTFFKWLVKFSCRLWKSSTCFLSAYFKVKLVGLLTILMSCFLGCLQHFFFYSWANVLEACRNLSNLVVDFTESFVINNFLVSSSLILLVWGVEPFWYQRRKREAQLSSVNTGGCCRMLSGLDVVFKIHQREQQEVIITGQELQTVVWVSFLVGILSHCSVRQKWLGIEMHVFYS